MPTVLPLVEPEGVVPEGEASPPDAFFAAFSASRFCFEAEGGMVVVCSQRRYRLSSSIFLVGQISVIS